MTKERDPVEVTTKFATTVPDLPAAWAFVMGKVDKVGPHPSITITPIWSVELLNLDPGGEDEYKRHFEVTVSGTVNEPEEK